MMLSSTQAVLRRLTGQSPFRGLNYTLANEDASVEYAVLPDRTSHVVSIAGSGSRVIPLLARFPNKLTCIDLSREQIDLTQLRVESARCLSHEEYLSFWGYPPFQKRQDRKQLFQKIDSLSKSARYFFEPFFDQIQWRSPLYEGRWERRTGNVSQLLRGWVGKEAYGIFQCSHLEEQRKYYDQAFPKLRWKAFLFSYGQLMDLLRMARPEQFPLKNQAETYYQASEKAFDRMFRNTLACENFFLQLVFFGEIKTEGAFPLECSAQVFQKVKKALQQTEVRYRLGDAVEIVKNLSEPADYLSFSNAPSYFRGRSNTAFLQTLSQGLSPGARVVARSFLHDPSGIDITGFQEMTSKFQSVLDKEKTQSYDIRVYQKLNHH